MTAQIAEKLRYQGEDVAMCTNPLSDYFAMGGTNPRFESNCTALWRGCIDPAVSAQVRPLMQMPQREFSCSAPDADADGCKSQSSPR